MLLAWATALLAMAAERHGGHDALLRTLVADAATTLDPAPNSALDSVLDAVSGGAS